MAHMREQDEDAPEAEAAEAADVDVDAASDALEDLGDALGLDLEIAEEEGEEEGEEEEDEGEDVEGVGEEDVELDEYRRLGLPRDRDKRVELRCQRRMGRKWRREEEDTKQRFMTCQALPYNLQIVMQDQRRIIQQQCEQSTCY